MQADFVGRLVLAKRAVDIAEAVALRLNGQSSGNAEKLNNCVSLIEYRDLIFILKNIVIRTDRHYILNKVSIFHEKSVNTYGN